MFITKKHMPRRSFLKGAGVTLALPLLDAMIPAQTALAQTAAQPYPRFMGIFYPHGMAPTHWEMPDGKFPEKLSTVMEPLQKVRDQAVVLGGLWSKSTTMYAKWSKRPRWDLYSRLSRPVAAAYIRA